MVLPKAELEREDGHAIADQPETEHEESVDSATEKAVRIHSSRGLCAAMPEFAVQGEI